MSFEKPLYLVDCDSPLVYAWPSYVFFVGDTRTPLLYEPDSPVKLAVPLNSNIEGHDDPFLIEKYGIGDRHQQLLLPVLCVTNQEQIGRVETLLYSAGLFPLIIDDHVFRIDDSYSLESILSNELVKRYQLRITEMPLTMPVDSFTPIPYVDHQGNLIISHACPPIWQRWKEGVSPGAVVSCFERVLPKDIYKKLQKDQPLHQKDQPPISHAT